MKTFCINSNFNPYFEVKMHQNPNVLRIRLAYKNINIFSKTSFRKYNF